MFALSIRRVREKINAVTKKERKKPIDKGVCYVG